MFLLSLVSCLRYRLSLPSKTSILQAISKEKTFFQTAVLERKRKLCRVDVAIDRVACQSKKQQEKNYSSGFLRSFTVPVSPSGIYGALFLPLMLLTKTAKKKTLFAGIRIYSREIAGFTEQRTAFTRAQSAILQSPDFNTRLQRA